MKIEVLYVPQCPHFPHALQRVHNVLAREGVSADVEQVLVSDLTAAERWQFPGSPTIRINGRDVEPTEETHPALTCRLYRGSDQPGLPAEDSIVRAIRAARAAEQQR